MNKLLLSLIALCALAVTGCVSTTSTDTATQANTAISAEVQSIVSVGLVPVLNNNPKYVDALSALGDGLTVLATTTSSSTLTQADFVALCATAGKKYPAFTADEQTLVAAMLYAAYNTATTEWQSKYKVNPNVTVYLTAAATGINNAVTTYKAAHTST